MYEWFNLHSFVVIDAILCHLQLIWIIVLIILLNFEKGFRWFHKTLLSFQNASLPTALKNNLHCTCLRRRYRQSLWGHTIFDSCIFRFQMVIGYDVRVDYMRFGFAITELPARWLIIQLSNKTIKKLYDILLF